MATETTLRVEFFGGLRISVKGVVDEELTPSVAPRLLAYLALHANKEASREALCDLLWENVPEESARKSLRQALYELRGILTLSPMDKDDLLIATRNSVRLNPNAITTDVGEFESYLAEASRASALEDKAALYASALALYKGEFLPGFYDEWAVLEQERLASAYHFACLEHLRILEDLGRADEATTLANKMLAANPCQEEVHCALMRIYATRGHANLVQRQAEALRNCLEANGLVAPRIATEEYVENLVQRARQATPSSKAPSPPPEAPAVVSSPALVSPPAPQPKKRRKERTLLLIPLALLVLLLWNRRTPPSQQTSAPPQAQGGAPSAQAPKTLSNAPASGSPQKTPPQTTSRAENPSTEPLLLRNNANAPKPQPILPAPAGQERVALTQRRDQKWCAYFPNETGDVDSRAACVKTDSKGNIYVGGFVENAKGGKKQVDYVILKYLPTGGKPKWITRFNGLDNDCDRVVDMALDSTGNVFVTGESENGKAHGKPVLSQWDIVTLKLNGDSGKIMKSERYDPSNGNSDRPVAIAVDSAGNVYVAGTSVQPTNETVWGADDIVVVKYNNRLEKVWEGRYDDPVHRRDEAKAMAADDNGNVYVTGTSGTNETGSDWATMKFNTNLPSGHPEWTELFDGTAHGDDAPTALVLGKTGNVFVTGYAGMHGRRKDFITIKYDNNGVQEWVASYDGSPSKGVPGDDDVALAIALDAEENVYVTGASDSSQANKDWATVKYSADYGNTIWVQRENGVWSRDDSPCKIAVGKNGDVYITGVQYGGPNGAGGTENDIVTICYHADKKEKPRWTSIFNGLPGRGSEQPYAMTLDREGNIIVAGQSDTGASPDIVVLKYAP